MSVLGCRYAFQRPTGAWFLTSKSDFLTKVTLVYEFRSVDIPHWRMLRDGEKEKLVRNDLKLPLA
eukprot:5684886-Amphidinium_carterae.1